jgi:N-acetylmuramoyl-L-alanine amidase/Putative peptidoglycan binding domain
MKIVISSGHGKKIRGASGSPVPPQCDEVDEARKVTEGVATALRKLGVDTITYHDDVSTTQSENLTRITDFHNSRGAHDYDVSVHFNCYDGSAHGTEVLYVSQQELAEKICDKIVAAGGFTNRGAKKRTDLKFLNATDAPAVLLEVAFCDNDGDCSKYKSNFDAICTGIAEGIASKEAQPGRPPIEAKPPSLSGKPPADRVQLSEGSEGPAVVGLQTILGIPADGEFGDITATQVEAFQAACGLTPDGIVGEKTWEAVEDLQLSLTEEEARLAAGLIEEITQIAQASPLDDYEWPDRGISPPGYITGMSLCFAVALQDLIGGMTYAKNMARPLGGSDTDALKWYEPELKKAGMQFATAKDRLRTLFALMIGLSMRESSGRYCEGRDMSADNVAADTCEAGLMQTSWNICTADPSLPGLLSDYWDNPNGFRLQFAENVDPTAENLDCYGSGEGARYQWLAKYSPCFAVMTSALGLRSRKDHWGPIKRKEVTINKEAEVLLRDVQDLIEKTPST